MRDRLKNRRRPVFSIALILLSILLIFGLAQISYAAEDFSASGYPEISGCSCLPQQSEIIVKNTGSSASTYKLQLGGDAAQYIAVAPLSFSLKAGESTKLYEYVNQKCGFLGSLNANVDIATSNGLVKRISQKITSKNCLNINLTSVKFEQTICPAGTAEYTFNLTNTGGYIETYELGIDTFKEESSYDENPITIFPGESRKATLYIQPSAQFRDDYEIEFFTLAETSKIKSTTPIFLYTDNCYNYSFSMLDSLLSLETINESIEAEFSQKPELSYNLCYGEQKFVPMQIENTANYEDEFYADLIGSPEWAALDSNYVKLAPKQVGSFNLVIYVPDTAGEFNFEVQAKNVLGEEIKKSKAKLVVENCFTPTIGEKKNSFKVTYDETITNIPVENTGERETEYKLEIQTDEDWITLDSETITLKAGESGSLGIATSPSEDISSGKYPIIVSLMSENEAVYTKDFTIELKSESIFAQLIGILVIYKWYVLAAFILLIIIVVAFLISKRKKAGKTGRQEIKAEKKEKVEKKEIKAKAEKKIEKKEKPKRKFPLWAIILIIALGILAALTYYYFDFLKSLMPGALEFLGVYKWYILVGAILLIAIITFLIITSKKKAKMALAEGKIFGAKKEEIREPEKPKLWPIYLAALIVLAIIAGIIYYIHIKIGYLKIAGFIWGIIKQIISYIWQNNYYFGIGILVLVILVLLHKSLTKFQKRNTLVKPLDLYPENTDISIKGKEAICIGEITLRLKNSVTGACLIIKSLGKKPTFLRAAPIVYKYIELTLKKLSKDDVSNLRIRFSVSKEWLSSNNVNKKEITLKRYEAGRWAEIPTRLIDEDESALYFESKIPEFSYFAVCVNDEFTKRIKQEEKEAKTEAKVAKTTVLLSERKIVAPKPEKKAKIVYEELKPKQRKKAPVWPIWVLVIIFLLVAGNIIYTNYGANINDFMNGLMNETGADEIQEPEGTEIQEPEGSEIQEQAETVIEYTTDEILSSIGDGIKYRYNKYKEVVDTEMDKVLTKKEFAELLDNNKETIAAKTSIPKQNIDAMIRALDPERGIYTGLIPSQEFDEDTTLELDLSDYFKDPDDDRLYFTFSRNEMIDIDIDNDLGVAYITPKADWYGREIVNVTADDLKGGIIGSELLLIVRDMPEPSLASSLISKTKESISNGYQKAQDIFGNLKSFFIIYYKYIISGIVILALIILFLKYNNKVLDFLEEDNKKKK